MNDKSFEQDILKLMRSWDALMRGRIAKGQKPAAWMVIDFIRFFTSTAVHNSIFHLKPEDYDFRRELQRFWDCYLESEKAIKGFEPGDVVGGTESEGCRVRIDSVSENGETIIITLVQTSEFWRSHGFPRGRQVEFVRAHTRKEVGYDTWVASDKTSVPWFILGIETHGTKTFAHSR